MTLSEFFKRYHCTPQEQYKLLIYLIALRLEKMLFPPF